jgi:TPR repeat protein
MKANWKYISILVLAIIAIAVWIYRPEPKMSSCVDCHMEAKVDADYASTRAELTKGDAAFSSKNYRDAMKVLRPLADRGIVQAQEKVGAMFEQGFGVQQDFSEAYYWYFSAALRGLRGDAFKASCQQVIKHLKPAEIDSVQKHAREDMVVQRPLKGENEIFADSFVPGPCDYDPLSQWADKHHAHPTAP